MEPDRTEVQYAGFWARVFAQIIDTILCTAGIVPLLYGLYGTAYMDFNKLMSSPLEYLLSYQPQTGATVLSYVVPTVALMAFWLSLQATPGKMLISAKVVDAVTRGKIGPGQAIGRILGYIVGLLSLGLGFVWVGFDARKQGWHDKLAGTLVIKSNKS